VKIEERLVYFQAIQETLHRTSLHSYDKGQRVHVERSARFGDEIGGHILSGHIHGAATLEKIEKPDGANVIFHIRCPQKWMSYIFEKGYIAVDGASLTVVDVFPEGLFTVHLIPETLSRTTFVNKKQGSLLNIELDSTTMSIVKTVERILASSSKK
jgi:riboflavin synthase